MWRLWGARSLRVTAHKAACCCRSRDNAICPRRSHSSLQVHRNFPCSQFLRFSSDVGIERDDLECAMGVPLPRTGGLRC